MKEEEKEDYVEVEDKRATKVITREEAEIEDFECDEREAPIRDMADVFEKVITPKSGQPDTTRDIKLTKTSWDERKFIIQLKTMIHICDIKGLDKAEKFYREFHDHYVNLLASDNATTLKALISSRQDIKKEITTGKEKKKRWI